MVLEFKVYRNFLGKVNKSGGEAGTVGVGTMCCLLVYNKNVLNTCMPFAFWFNLSRNGRCGIIL